MRKNYITEIRAREASHTLSTDYQPALMHACKQCGPQYCYDRHCTRAIVKNCCYCQPGEQVQRIGVLNNYSEEVKGLCR